MALTKYIKAPVAGSLPQYVDSEFRKLALALDSIERAITPEIIPWTPVVYGSITAGTATYTIQEGTCYKVGRRVDYKGRVAYTGHTGSGLQYMSGFPFNAALDDAVNTYWIINLWTDVSTMKNGILGPGNNNLMRFYGANASGHALVASAQMIISGTCWVTS